jgi:hypothetical protein
MKDDGETTAKVIGTVTLVGGLVALWYLFFRDEKSTTKKSKSK